MDDLAQVFGKLLATHRKQRGWTQLQLAERAQLSQEMITKLEAGQTGASFKAIERLAGALELDPSAFFSVAASADRRKHFNELLTRIGTLSEADAEWALRLIEVGLSRQG